MCSVKNVFLEISQNPQENTCARDFFNKVAGHSPAKWEIMKVAYKSGFYLVFREVVVLKVLQNTNVCLEPVDLLN